MFLLYSASMKIPAAKKGRSRGFTKTVSKRYSKRPSSGKVFTKPTTKSFAKSLKAEAIKKPFKNGKPSPTFTIVERKPRILPPSTLAPGLERLERYMAHTGMASRREAKDLIMRSLVMVNGKNVREPGFGINPDKDVVTLKGDKMPQKETYMLYKPRGIETSATVPGVTDIKSRFPKLAHLSPIGRLDKDSQGLILMSNDGTLTRAMTSEDSHIEKEYLVTVREEVGDDKLNRMATGIMIDKITTKPAIVERRGRSVFSIVLKEGRKHQIRRMCDACHLTITSLVRVRIGHLVVAKMIAGNVKSIAPKDVEKLKQS